MSIFNSLTCRAQNYFVVIYFHSQLFYDLYFITICLFSSSGTAEYLLVMRTQVSLLSNVTRVLGFWSPAVYTRIKSASFGFEHKLLVQVQHVHQCNEVAIICPSGVRAPVSYGDARQT